MATRSPIASLVAQGLVPASSAPKEHTDSVARTVQKTAQLVLLQTNAIDVSRDITKPPMGEMTYACLVEQAATIA